jgi:carboxyl-terminal processing protease
VSGLLLIAITAFMTLGIANPFGFLAYNELFSFNQAVNRIHTLYYGEVTMEQLFDGAMRGMAFVVGDPYTRFIGREDAESFAITLEGSYSGVGMWIAESLDDEHVIVVEVIPDTPAYRAGILSGDLILKVDGAEVFDSYEAADLIRGITGTQVVITVKRHDDGEITELTLTRERIEVPTVDARIFDNNIAYFAVSQFSRTTPDELLERLNELDFEPAGIIIDLRNNGGGIMETAIEIADIFLPRNTLVVYSEGRGSRRREYKTRMNE